MDITFRAAEIFDTNTLLVLMKAFYAFESLPFKESVARTALEKILREDSLGYVWLIQADSEIIGYVILTLGYSLEYGGRDAFVDEIFIQEHYRGHGIGAKALQLIEDTCRMLGVRALHLEVERKNTRAYVFYRKFGFEDHDRYLMTKRIITTQESEVRSQKLK
jgi:GNAT superfamily N-acetyltransferase